MATFHVCIVKSQKKQDGTWNVKIRVTHNGKSKRISTPWYVSKDDITKGYKIKAQNVLDTANKAVSKYRERFIALGIDAMNMSVDDIVANITEDNKERGIPFFPWAYDFVSKKGNGKGVYLSALNTFKKHVGENVTFQSITGKMMRTWADTMGVKTAYHKIPRLQSIFNAGRKFYNDEDAGVIVIPNNPFAKLELEKPDAPRKRAVTAEAVRMIAQIPDEKHIRSLRNLCRDFFVLSFGLIGMNAADLYDCKCKIEDGWIEYCRMKTRKRRADNAFMRVRIPNYIMPWIERYKDHFGCRTFKFYRRYTDHKQFDTALAHGMSKVEDALVEMYREMHKEEKLKDADIKKRLQIEDLEPYAARHTWATIARNECKIDKFTVHEALNHVDKETKVTDLYIKKDFSLINEANDKVIEYVFGNNEG